MGQFKVFANLIYAFFAASCPLFLKLKAIIHSLMEYNPAAQVLIKRQQRAAIACTITLQTKHFSLGESNQFSEFVLMKNNLRAQNPLIYHAEVTITLYIEDYSPASGQNASSTERTNLWRTTVATRRTTSRFKYTTSSRSTSPIASRK